jgi:hypothetical protein
LPVTAVLPPHAENNRSPKRKVPRALLLKFAMKGADVRNNFADSGPPMTRAARA